MYDAHLFLSILARPLIGMGRRLKRTLIHQITHILNQLRTDQFLLRALIPRILRIHRSFLKQFLQRPQILKEDWDRDRIERDCHFFFFFIYCGFRSGGSCELRSFELESRRSGCVDCVLEEVIEVL